MSACRVRITTLQQATQRWQVVWQTMFSPLVLNVWCISVAISKPLKKLSKWFFFLPVSRTNCNWTTDKVITLQSLWRLWSDALRADRWEQVICSAGRLVFGEQDFILLWVSLLTLSVCSYSQAACQYSETQPSFLSHLYLHSRMSSAVSFPPDSFGNAVLKPSFPLLCKTKSFLSFMEQHSRAFLYKVIFFNIIRDLQCSLQTCCAKHH